MTDKATTTRNRNRPSKSVASPVKGFTSPGGRRFTVGTGVRQIYPSEWSEMFPVSYKGKPAGTLIDSNKYTSTRLGDRRKEPVGRGLRWSGSVDELRWSTPGFVSSGKRIGYDVSAFDTVEECLLAWGRSADQILDWAEANARGGGGARARRAPAAQARLYGLHVREDAGGRWRWHRGSDVILRPFANDAEVEAALSRLGVYMPRGADTLTWSKDGKLAVIREFGVEPAVRLVARA